MSGPVKSPATVTNWSNAAAINAEINQIAIDFPTVASVVPVGMGLTVEGREIKAIRLKTGTGANRVQALVIGGLHAREWAPPQALLSYARVIADAFTNLRGVRYRRLRFTNVPADPEHDGNYTGDITLERKVLPHAHINAIFSNLDLYIIPCINLDGRNYSVTAPSPPNPVELLLRQFWRTNRNLNPTPCATYNTFGVDLNRNFPSSTWNYLKYYSNDTKTLKYALRATSPLPCTLTPEAQNAFNNETDPVKKQNITEETRQSYKGSGAGSEPEIVNLTSFINAHDFRFFLDVHSYGRMIMYPAGSHHNQSDDPTQSYLNTSYDYNGSPGSGRKFRRLPIFNPYKEYMPISASPPRAYDLGAQNIFIANQMHHGIKKSSGFSSDTNAEKRSEYKVQQAKGLYPTIGASDDYMNEKNVKLVNGQVVIDEDNFPIHALAMECGHETEGGFHPWLSGATNYEYAKIEREVHFGVTHFLLYAAHWKPIYKP